jgi:hypothetical protein
MLLLKSADAIPEGLEDYTDGWMADVKMVIGGDGAYADETYRTCWGGEYDVDGHFCYGYVAGEDFQLLHHVLSYRPAQDEEAESLQRGGDRPADCRRGDTRPECQSERPAGCEPEDNREECNEDRMEFGESEGTKYRPKNCPR